MFNRATPYGRGLSILPVLACGAGRARRAGRAGRARGTRRASGANGANGTRPGARGEVELGIARRADVRRLVTHDGCSP